MTHARDIYQPLLAIGIPALLIALVALAILLNWRAVLAEVRRPLARLWAWWDVRCQKAEARLARAGARDVTPIDTAALDDWQAAILADPLPEDTQPIPVPWPTPLSPRVHERALMLPDPQPLPVKWEPLLLPAQTYASAAAEFAHDMRDGVEVYDVDTYAAGVIRRLHSTVDAPVSPAPWMEHRPRHASELVGRGVITGTSAQRHRWETETTGAFQVVTPELIGVGAA